MRAFRAGGKRASRAPPLPRSASSQSGCTCTASERLVLEPSGNSSTRSLGSSASRPSSQLTHQARHCTHRSATPVASPASSTAPQRMHMPCRTPGCGGQPSAAAAPAFARAPGQATCQGASKTVAVLLLLQAARVPCRVRGCDLCASACAPAELPTNPKPLCRHSTVRRRLLDQTSWRHHICFLIATNY